MISHSHRALVLLAALCGGLALFAQNGHAMDMEEVCLGRLALNLPREREVISASGRIDDVLIEPIEGSEGRGLQSLLEAEIQRLDAKTHAKGGPPEVRMFGTAGVWRYLTWLGAPSPDAAHGVVVVAGQALRLDSRGDETVIDEVTRAVERVAQGLVPTDTPPANGFCLPMGQMMAMDYGGYNEEISVQYRLKTGETLDITTSTNGDSLEESLQQLVATGRAELAAGLGFEMQVSTPADLHSDSFDGEAVSIPLGDAGELHIWRALGAPRSPANPVIDIRIQSEGPSPQAEALLRAIVASLRPIGAAR